MFDSTVPLHRRDTLKMGVAALAGLAFGRTSPAEDKMPDAGFNLSVQSYTFRNFSAEQTAQKLMDLKVPFVEWTQKHVPLNSTPEQIKAILKLGDDHKIKPISYGVQSFTKNHDTNRKTFDFARQLGLKYISADPTPDSFDSLDKLVEEYKIAIAIHPHGPTNLAKKQRAIWCTADQIMKAVKDHHELIGTCLDTGHLLRMELIGEKVDVIEQIKIMGKRNYGFHLKDHDLKKDVDVVFGDPAGHLNIPEILKTLKEVNFKGYLSIEYEANAQEPTKDVAACIEYLRAAFAKMA